MIIPRYCPQSLLNEILKRVALGQRTRLSFKIASDYSRQIYPPYSYREGKYVKIGCYRLFSLVYLFLVKHISYECRFCCSLVPFRNQIVIQDSFTDINVGTIRWIRVEPETRVNWILKEVRCYFR